MSKWFNIFVYLSFGFLIVALIESDYLKIPDIVNYSYIVLSVVFVCIGFLLDSFSWYRTLRNYGYLEVKVSDSIISMGLSIFGKYLPGKVWSIIGRSSYISKIYGLHEKDAAVISLNAQFISFWVGLLLGIIGLVINSSKAYFVEISLIVWILFTFIIFSRVFHNLFIQIIRKFFRSEIIIPSLSIQSTFKLIPWFLIYWIFWCLGFYFLIRGLSQNTFGVSVGLSFALAGTLSLIVIVIPGALGVRETLLTTLLVMMGFDERLAITISLTSRLWFLFGEFFIFLIALVCKHQSSIIRIFNCNTLK
jgi:glycosyltransferase 2 family protein